MSTQYAICPACSRGVAVTRYGCVYKHKRTIEKKKILSSEVCPSSGQYYAFGDLSIITNKKTLKKKKQSVRQQFTDAVRKSADALIAANEENIFDCEGLDLAYSAHVDAFETCFKYMSPAQVVKMLDESNVFKE